jgi:hypothetical protein
MPGESPLNMMQPQRPRPQRPRHAGPPPRRRLWPVLLPVGAVALIAAGWCALWYYAAGVADQAMTGWIAREAVAGRIYSCGSRSIGGFPFRIAADCANAGATIGSTQPPFAATATDISVTAEVYHPTRLMGDVTGPVTLAEPGQPPSFVANWTRARASVSGLPPQPDAVSVTLDHPKVDRGTGANATTIFAADSSDFDARLVGGSATANPVIDALLKFTAATTPTLHPLLAEPLQGEIEAEFRGFKDLLPKPWPQRFREMAAAGGSIEIKRLRLERSDAIIVGAGTLTVNPNGKLNGLIRVAVAGLENIVPKLGLDRLIGRGLDRLGGGSGQAQQGLNALDRLLPGLSGVVRDSASAMVIDNLNKMGQPTEIDKKPAIVLPLNVSDGFVSLGMVPLGEVPALF